MMSSKVLLFYDIREFVVYKISHMKTFTSIFSIISYGRYYYFTLSFYVIKDNLSFLIFLVPEFFVICIELVCCRSGNKERLSDDPDTI